MIRTPAPASHHGPPEDPALNHSALLLLPACIHLAAAPDLPLQSGLAVPADLDLRQALDPALLPKDAREASQVEASRLAWKARVQPLAGAPAVRLLLPAGPLRLPLLLAASQALKAQDPRCRVYLAFDPAGGSMMEELAWGAVEGGALLPEDLGTVPDRWRDRLVEAQGQFPGRPWTLWVPVDPGPRTAMLMGDGGRLVVPQDGPAARLAQQLPEGYTEVEGGLGDLTLSRRGTGDARRWKFEGGEWRAAQRFRDRHAVEVVDREAYDVGALLARMRATQVRDRAAIRHSISRLDYSLHFQAERGNFDLAFQYRSFEKAGEQEEALREQLTFNGVAAKLHGDAQLPMVEAKATMATPVALTLTERYRYQDGGPAGPGRRRVHFEPVDRNPLLAEGELIVSEDTGRVLEERSRRSGLPGVVRSEDRTMTYGEPEPGLWRVMRIQSNERWMTNGAMIQVLRTAAYGDFRINAPGFESERESARKGEGSMIQQTPEGVRNYARQKDGTRKADDKLRSGGKGVAGVVLVDPSGDFPVLPLAGYLLFDFNAFDRGIQYSILTAGVFNNFNFTVPNVAWGVDFHAGATLVAFGGTERPVVNGRLQDRDGVGRRTQSLDMDLSRDLGAGFRLGLGGKFTYDQFSDPKEDKYHTPGFQNPASGLNRYGEAELTWQHSGFKIRSNYGVGRRPDGIWGAPGQLSETPEEGRYRRWGGAFVYDVDLGRGLWFQTTLGGAAGRNFDRFQAIDFDGMVSGIKSHAVAADRITYGALRLTVPTGPKLRLNFGLDHGRARSMDDLKTYGFTGLNVAGDLPGFWWFSTVRIQMGVGLQSDIPGLRTVNGMLTFIRLL